MEQIGSEYNFNTGGSIKALNDLIVRVGELDKQVQKLGKTTKDTGDTVSNLPNKTKKASSGFDALGNSINQVTREFPAFAFSAQTGFLAVSNNIPILLDSINDLKKANAALTAEGKASIPIFKQIISSLFSWQTALSLAISFSVMYGKEIGNFIGELFKGKEALDSMKISFNAINETYKDKGLSTAITNLKFLQSSVTEASKTLDGQKWFIDEYNKSIGTVTGSVNTFKEAEQGIIYNTDAYVQAIIKRITVEKLAAQYSDLVVKQAFLQIENERELQAERTHLLALYTKGQGVELKTQEQYYQETGKINKNLKKETETQQEYILRRVEWGVARKAVLLNKEVQDIEKQKKEIDKVIAKFTPGMALDIDDGSKQREAAKLKAIKDAEAKAKAILDKKVQDELKAVQEIYIKSVESKDATNKSKEDAEIKLLESQRDIFEKYKKYDEKYAQDSLDTREKLAEMKLSISEKENAERIKLLQEEYKSDDAFMQKTIDNELDAIDEKYVAIREGAILSSEEQKLLDLKQTQDKIQALEKVKDAGEKYSDELVKLKKKESLLITSINKETADEEIKIKQQVVAKLLDLGQVGVNELTKYRTDSNNYETEQEIANAQKLYDSKSITEDEFNRRKAQALNQQARTQREIDLSQIQINTALSIIKTFAQFGYPAGIPLAILAAAEGAVQYAFASAQPLPQFAKGTDMVSGGIRGKDSVHALLMPQEAVIPTKENLARPGLAKAWIDGNLDRHLMMNYIRPAIDENNRRWEASLKVNQNSTFIRNDNFSDKRIVNGLDRINRKLSNKEQRVVITKSKGRIWN